MRSITDPDVEPHFAEFVQSVDSGEVKVSAVELSGDVVDAVVEYASRAPADLVVVAAQARSHGPYWRPGAYANDLVRRLSSPLLAVPASGDAAPLSNSEAVADLIVVSRPQRGDHLSMNSSLAAVLRKAAHPVLVVPTTSADPVDVPWENVAFAEPALSR